MALLDGISPGMNLLRSTDLTEIVINYFFFNDLSIVAWEWNDRFEIDFSILFLIKNFNRKSFL